MGIEQYLKEKALEINKEIERIFPKKLDKEWLKKAFGEPLFVFDEDSATKSIASPIWDFLDRGGKRWRPALMLLSNEALGGNPKEIMPFVALPELIHNGCVTEETLVWGADGIPKKITEFKKGEKVLSVASNGSIVSSTILKTFDNGIKEVFLVKSQNRKIIATENHPFLVVSKNQPTRMKITEHGKIELEIKIAEMDLTISEFCEKTYPSLKKNQEFSLKHLKNVLYGCPHCLLPIETAKQITETLGMETNQCWQKKQCLYEKAEIILEWKELKDLKKGDLIVVSKEIASEAGELPKIPQVKQNYKDRNIIPKEFSIEMAQLAGFILGDGCIDVGKVTLCIPENMPGREKYTKLIEKIFGATPSQSRNTITICSKAIAAIFRKLGLGKKSLEKEIDDWVFKLPKNHKLAFIKGYLDSDGSVSKDGRAVFDCANKKIITKLKALLDSLGFITSNIFERTVDNTHFKRKVKKKETKLYAVHLYSRNRVLEEIGSEIVEYRNRLEVVAQRQVNLRFKELVPNMPEGFTEKKFGFNKIVKIERMGKKNTYDLQIEGTHNYISNGIITHNTIMVDDIEDGAEIRRGKPCTHKKYGLDIAINAANAMYFIPATMLYTNMKELPAETKTKIYDLYAKSLLEVSFGQGMDIYWHRGEKEQITEKEYLQMCAYKTGTLARFSAKVGAILANGTKEQIEKLGKFATMIGVGFQIQDDVLNLLPQSGKWGKETGEDIKEGKRTLMAIHSMENGSQEDKKTLKEILNRHAKNQGDVKKAIKILEKNGSIEYSKNKAKELVKNAWKEVEPLLKESEAKNRLKAFADYLIERTY